MEESCDYDAEAGRLMQSKRILVLVPHPDDEIVACAAAIGRAKAEGGQVFALYLTHGCIARDTLWPWRRRDYDMLVARRRAEAEMVAAFLGITPVGWSLRPARHLWRDLAAVYREAEAAIAHYGIDEVWLPAYEGGNADHDGLNALGVFLKRHVTVIEFAEYNYAGRKTHSQAFPFPNGTETILILTPDEQYRKRAALALYPSEKLNLSYVKSVQEACRPLANYDYSKPPHEGTLWYARFQWVPFRHPQVDFTQPAEVCQAIVDFLNNQRPS